MKKLLLVVAAGVGLVALGWWFLRRDRGGDGNQYTLAAVEYGPITERVSATGVVQPRETVTVGTELSGQVVEVLADFNQTVEEGELLLRLDDRLPRQRLAQAQTAGQVAEVGVKQAQVQLDHARTDLKRIEQRPPEVRVQAELDGARARLRAAEVDLEAAAARVCEAAEGRRQAELALRLTEVRAPVYRDDSLPPASSGDRVGVGVLDPGAAPPAREKRTFTVLERRATLGQQVGPPQSAQLFTLAGDLGRVRVVAQVAEGDIGKVARGQAAEFTVAGEGDTVFTGRVEEVRLVPTLAHGAVFYEALLDAANRRNAETGEWRLRPGLTATVDVVRRRHEAAWKVPLAALAFQPEGAALTDAARAKEERWRGRPDADAWKPVWVVGADRRPWPVFVRVGRPEQPGSAIQDLQFSEVLEWDPELQPAPRPTDPSTWPQLITAAAPARQHGLFAMPRIKL